MKCMKKWVLSEPSFHHIDSQDILSNTCKYYELNLKTASKQDLDYLKEFKLSIEIDGKISAFVAWFDC